MDFDDEEMLFDADSIQHSSQEPLTDEADAFWVFTDNTQDASPAQHSIIGSTTPADSESQWDEENLFVATEELSPQELPASNDTRITSHAYRKERVISHIESVFESMLDVLLKEERSLTVMLKSRSTAANSDHPGKLVCFPGKTADEAWRFTVLIRILEIIHEALVTDCVISKREIYYRHPALFRNQLLVDRYIDDIAFTFGASRSLLNVTAAAKGLVAGTLTILKANSIQVQSFDDPAGQLIPRLDEGDKIQTAAKWILVIEKEASFRSIAASGLWEVLRHDGIMITGKGYPDLSTRIFLHKLSTATTMDYFYVPIYALVDLDPDGLSIMCTYKYGSKPLAHEGDWTRVPDLKWLGVRSIEAFATGNIEDSGLMAASVHQNEGLLHLTHRDRRKATGMLSKQFVNEGGLNHELKRELQVMLMLNMKAEIEILESRDGGLASWLMERLNT